MMNWTPALIAEAQAIYEAGNTPTRVAEKLRGRYHFKLTAAEVRPILKMKTHARALQDGLREKIVRLKQSEGLSNSLIAERLGIEKHTVDWVCNGIRPGPGVRRVCQSSRPHEVRKAAAQKAPEPDDVQIPGWVPSRLHDLYATISERDCEEQAAIVCRRLKHGASVAYL